MLLYELYLHCLQLLIVLIFQFRQPTFASSSLASFVGCSSSIKTPLSGPLWGCKRKSFALALVHSTAPEVEVKEGDRLGFSFEKASERARGELEVVDDMLMPDKEGRGDGDFDIM